MKIKTTVTEIECNAEELRQSNTVADGLLNLLRNTFNYYSNSDDDEVEEDTNDIN